jgi:nitroreductase
MNFDIPMTDELLSTTRAVRKRLDFTRPVPREIIDECLELAVQAPTGGNSQGWRWLLVDDADKRRRIADWYRKGAEAYLAAATATAQVGGDGDLQMQRVFNSASYLAEHLHEAPVFLIPCVTPRLPEGTPEEDLAGFFGSVFPAIWSFQLALRARGLGSCLTTLHLKYEKQVAEIVGLPGDMMQMALLPVAFTKGTQFKRAKRAPVRNITHWNEWKSDP